MRKLSLFLFLLMLCAACATMGNNREAMLDNFLQGKQAYEDNDYAKAFELLKPAAEAGNPNAQYYLAILYDFGRGVPTSHEQANAWYLKAAEQGQDDAQYNLAISYRRGEGIEQDTGKAIYWLGRAAALGDDDAMDVLTSYAEGNDDAGQAQYALAQIYRDGVTLHNNPTLYPSERDNSDIAPDMEAYQYWLKRAADNNYPQAVQELAK